MPRRPALRLLAVLALVSAAACVDDPIQPDKEIPLSEEEARLLGLSAFREALVSGLEAPPDTTAAALAPLLAESFFQEDSTSVPCELGGFVAQRVVVSGRPDDGTGTVTFGITVIQNHLDCQTAEGGTVFHLDGDPALTLDFDFVIKKDGSISLDGSLTGGVRATVGYRSSTCRFDVAFTGIARSDGSSSSEVAGTVCGEPVSETMHTDG